MLRPAVQPRADSTTAEVLPHRWVETLLLHLGPGAAAAATYVLLLPVARGCGLPSVAALALSAITTIAPVQLGILLWRRCLPVRLGAQLRWPTMLGLTLLVVTLAGAVFAALGPLGGVVQHAAFGWWPPGWEVSLGTQGGYSRVALLGTAGLVLIGSVVVAPVTEELYFRGYLLPRMPERLGRAGPVAHAALFGCYHLWTPWLAPTRFLAVLPLVLVVHRTHSLRVGIVAHTVLNAVDVVLILTSLTSHAS